MKSVFSGILLLILSNSAIKCTLVVNTWDFEFATTQAWGLVDYSNSPIDAVVSACRTCEKLQCGGTVGFGGAPDENGETFLEAMIMHGTTKDAGAVSQLRNNRNAISTARDVMMHTDHTILVGQGAYDFAAQLVGYAETMPTETEESIGKWRAWTEGNCQPNFWTANTVQPDPRQHCGPYSGSFGDEEFGQRPRSGMASEASHDTIGIIVVDRDKNFVVGTSSNGLSHKIPGRMGDAAIIGSGAYADSEFGAAVATGDGDVMMRFLPSFLAVEELRRGTGVNEAAEVAIRRIATSYPGFFGAIIVVDREERIGVACNGMESFPYTLANSTTEGVITLYATCLKL